MKEYRVMLRTRGTHVFSHQYEMISGAYDGLCAASEIFNFELDKEKLMEQLIKLKNDELSSVSEEHYGICPYIKNDVKR